MRIAASACAWLLAAVAGAAAALETPPVPVAAVLDGDTIEVELTPGLRTRVRIRHIDTPEAADNAHGKAMTEGGQAGNALRRLLPRHAQVRLWTPGAQFERDADGRTLAVVLLGAAGGDSVQERQIRAGWSVYWRRYGDVPQPELHRRWLAAQDAARAERAGAWATAAAWMQAKAGERQAGSQPGVNARQAAHWLNTANGIRHNAGCRYYKKTAEGRPCAPGEGKPCSVCGG